MFVKVTNEYRTNGKLGIVVNGEEKNHNGKSLLSALVEEMKEQQFPVAPIVIRVNGNTARVRSRKMIGTSIYIDIIEVTNGK